MLGDKLGNVDMNINLIDIGSSGGFDIPWKIHSDKIGKVLCFEPNDEPSLEDDYIVYNTGVWNHDGEEKFYRSGRYGHGSSLLRQNENWVKKNWELIKNEGDYLLNSTWFERSTVNGEGIISVRKLDTILESLRGIMEEGEKFHFLKSDTQSGEWYILDGAKKYIEEDCLGLELELYRYPLYKGMILEDEVKQMLEDMGFQVAGWTGYHNSFNSQADYLFIRKLPRNKGEAALISMILDIYKPTSRRMIKQLPLARRTTRLIKRKLRNALTYVGNGSKFL